MIDAPCSSARRSAVANTSTPIGPSLTGTRSLRYSPSFDGTMSATPGRTRAVNAVPRRLRTTTNTTKPASSHSGPAIRAASCVASERTKIAAVSAAPSQPVNGIPGARNGRGRSGSTRRSRTTAS